MVHEEGEHGEGSRSDRSSGGGEGAIDEGFARAMAERIVGLARFTAEEVAQRSGMPVDETDRLWTELGFPPVNESERFFTEADVEVLATLRELQATGLASPEVTIGMTRVLGQAMARVAMAQAQNIAAVAGEHAAHRGRARRDGRSPRRACSTTSTRS